MVSPLRSRALAAALLIVSACSGSDGDPANDTDGSSGDAFEGLWKLNLAKVSSDCGDFEDESFPTPFFHITASEEVEGAIDARTCTGKSDCRDFADEDRIFSWDGPAQAWRYTDVFSVYNSETCTRRASERVLSIRPDGSVRIESRKAEEGRETAGTQAQCDKFAAGWEPDFESMEPLVSGSPEAGLYSCERWVGSRVAEAPEE